MQDIIERLTPSEQQTLAAMITAARMQGFWAAEQNLEQAKAMGYQLALDRVAEMDAATRSRSQLRHEAWVARQMAEMQEATDARHAREGTREWKGVDNGDQLPSSDWYGNNHEYVRTYNTVRKPEVDETADGYDDADGM